MPTIIPMARKRLAYELYRKGWSLAVLAKYFLRTRQAVHYWIQEYQKSIDN